MKRESIVFLISGTAFGLLVGWIIGSQRVLPASPPTPPPAQQAAQASGRPPAQPADPQRAAALERTAAAEPQNSTVRVDLGNLYFNAEQYQQAAPWYEAALKLNAKDVNASTDLAVCYYYLQQDDRALQQLDYSLSIDPNHVKTLFNQGVIRAFGKQDLDGATQAWRRVIAIAPNSEEGQRVKQILDGLASGHTPGQPKK
jgi:tetratricopeptide (TPR) repeat protein